MFTYKVLHLSLVFPKKKDKPKLSGNIVTVSLVQFTRGFHIVLREAEAKKKQILLDPRERFHVGVILA